MAINDTLEAGSTHSISDGNHGFGIKLSIERYHRLGTAMAIGGGTNNIGTAQAAGYQSDKTSDDITRAFMNNSQIHVPYRAHEDWNYPIDTNEDSNKLTNKRDYGIGYEELRDQFEEPPKDSDVLAGMPVMAGAVLAGIKRAPSHDDFSGV